MGFFDDPLGTIGGGIKKLTGIATGPFERESQYSEIDPGGKLGGQAQQSSNFADLSQGNFGSLGKEAGAERSYLRRLASGQDSVSAEQLRQGLQQNIAGQMSMAASARPGMAPMAARAAMMNAGRAASGMAGQQALAGLQERQMAHQGLANMLMQQRQQELQAALQSRQNALSGYGGIVAAGTGRYGADKGTPTGAETLLGGLGSFARASQGGG